jgi:transposase-like protein
VRRSWSADEVAALLGEYEAPGANISELARRIGRSLHQVHSHAHKLGLRAHRRAEPMREHLLELAKGPSGFTGPQVTLTMPPELKAISGRNAVINTAKRLASANPPLLFRAVLGRRTVHFFDDAERAAAYQAKHRRPQRVEARSVHVRRSSAPWPADAPVNFTPATKWTYAPAPIDRFPASSIPSPSAVKVFRPAP